MLRRRDVTASVQNHETSSAVRALRLARAAALPQRRRVLIPERGCYFYAA